jgi:ubiquinone biosynthesis protein UbiJ
MEIRDFVDMQRSFLKMGFAIGRTTLDMLKAAVDSYVSMYEMYLRQFVPSESYESVKRAIDIYMESQSKVYDNFKKLLDQFEKQQEEILSRFVEIAEKVTPKKKE